MGQQSDSDLWPGRQADHAFITLTLGPSGWPSLASGFDFPSQLSHLPPNSFETHPSSSLLIWSQKPMMYSQSSWRLEGLVALS